MTNITYVISNIVPAARRAGRFEIEVDGSSRAIVSLDAIERLGLAVGKSIIGIESSIDHEAALTKVFDRALDMLAFRARSSRELARALVRKGEEQATVDIAVARLQQHGLLDDAAYARSFTRAKVLGAKQSKRRVQQGLARKGVAREVSDTAIEAVFEDEGVDQGALVLDVARKKARLLAKLAPEVQRRRLYAFLARRGYDADDIRRAMAEVKAEA